MFMVKKLLLRQFSLKLSSFFRALHLNFLRNDGWLVGWWFDWLIGAHGGQRIVGE